MGNRPRRVVAAALISCVTFALAGCGSNSNGGTEAEAGDDLSATPAAQATAAPPSDAKVIGITITADSVSPSGTRIEVKRNQPVVLEIDAAAAGELHVHSTPEMHIEFPAGKSKVQISIDKPGVVDVEDHSLDKLIVQLEVK
jgi:hypothetical protein